VDVTSDTVAFNQWAPQLDRIATVGRHVGGKDVIHLLSYRNATHLDWCDTKGDQGEPDALQNIVVSIAASKQPSRVWCASPDDQQGAAIELEFSYSGGQVELTLPAMKYYTMLVFEY
jgi:dextranase